MKMKFSLSYSAWIEGIEVEGRNEEECREALRNMTIEQLLENEGYIKDEQMEDVEGKVVEYTLSVNVTDIKYKPDEDMSEEEIDKLPKTMNFVLTVEEDEDLEDEILDHIEMEVNTQTSMLVEVDTFKYTTSEIESE